MTRKDYVCLATAVRSARPAPLSSEGGYAWHDTVVAIAKALADHNPNFDKGRFIAACKE